MQWIVVPSRIIVFWGGIVFFLIGMQICTISVIYTNRHTYAIYFYWLFGTEIDRLHFAFIRKKI